MAIDTKIGTFDHPIKVLEYGASHQDWLAARYDYIGGSEAAIALDVSPFNSRVALILEKTGVIESWTGNEATYWGTKLESLILDECKFRFFNKPGDKVDFEVGMMKHPEHDFMSANVDGLGWSKDLGFTIIEAKNVGSRIGAKEWNGGHVPHHYFCQVQQYFAVLGKEFQNALICGLFSGNHFEARLIERDDEFIARLIEAERDLWDRIQNKQWKDLVDDMAATGSAIDKLFADTKDETIKIESKQHIEACKAYCEANDAIKASESKKLEAKNLLKSFLCENENAVCEGFAVRWRKTARGERRFEIKREE